MSEKNSAKCKLNPDTTRLTVYFVVQFNYKTYMEMEFDFEKTR